MSPLDTLSPERRLVSDDSKTIDIDTVDIPEGGLLVKTLYVSVDPYMRGRMRHPGKESYVPPFAVGQPLKSHGVGVTVRSKNAESKDGVHAYGFFIHQACSAYPNKADLIIIEN